MTALLERETCDHPEDVRGPLPYSGKPPRGDEWECLACGVWHVVEESAAEKRPADGSLVLPADDYAALVLGKVSLPKMFLNNRAVYDLTGITLGVTAYGPVSVGDALRSMRAHVRVDAWGGATIKVPLPDDRPSWSVLLDDARRVGRAVQPPFRFVTAWFTREVSSDANEVLYDMCVASRTARDPRFLMSPQTRQALGGLYTITSAPPVPMLVYGLPLELRSDVRDGLMVLAVTA